MFDLNEHLRRWRDETEATLAFDPDELDELEDHLRSAYETSLREKLPPETAWQNALRDLGPASALAVEFTKSKLLPAFGRLLLAWLKPALLLALFITAFVVLQQDEHPTARFGFITGGGFLLLLAFLPCRHARNAILFGLGISFCLIPFLHDLINLSLQHELTGPRGHWPGHSLGLLPSIVAGISLPILILWWRRHQRTSLETSPSSLAIAGVVILVFGVAPMVTLWIGNLAMSPIYHLPTGAEIPYTGESRSDYLKWQFVAVLVEGMASIHSLLSFSLLAFIAAGVVLHQTLLRRWNLIRASSSTCFPSTADLPWCLMLLSSGLVWIVAAWVEAPFHENMQTTAESVSYVGNVGLTELLPLVPALLFLLSAQKVGARLTPAIQVRPFYAWMLITVQILVALAVLTLRLLPGHTYQGKPEISGMPLWLFELFLMALVFTVLPQIRQLRQKNRLDSRSSLWKFNGTNLVQTGLLLGLLLACASLILVQVALAMAYISVSQIHCMIDWGNSTKPGGPLFNASIYGTQDYLEPLIYMTLVDLLFCLSAGLFLTIILSGLEFLRFNAYRLYKVRQLRQAPVPPSSEPALEP